MSASELPVTAFATTASTLHDINVNNTLFVTKDPDGSMGRVYWQGRRVTDITVQAITRGSFAAVVEFEGQQMEIGSPTTPFVYDGQSFTKPVIDGFLFGWTVTHDEATDTIID